MTILKHLFSLASPICFHEIDRLSSNNLHQIHVEDNAMKVPGLYWHLTPPQKPSLTIMTFQLILSPKIGWKIIYSEDIFVVRKGAASISLGELAAGLYAPQMHLDYLVTIIIFCAYLRFN